MNNLPSDTSYRKANAELQHLVRLEKGRMDNGKESELSPLIREMDNHDQ